MACTALPPMGPTAQKQPMLKKLLPKRVVPEAQEAKESVPLGTALGTHHKAAQHSWVAGCWQHLQAASFVCIVEQHWLLRAAFGAVLCVHLQQQRQGGISYGSKVGEPLLPCQPLPPLGFRACACRRWLPAFLLGLVRLTAALWQR